MTLKNMQLGDKIRHIRTLKGLSQENVAELLGINLNAYGDIERNKTPNLSVARLEQIAQALGVSTVDILSFGEKIANFFENCSSVVGVSNGSGNGIQTNHYDARELVHQIEILKLELKNRDTDNEKLQLRAEKAEFEAKHWKEKFEGS